MLDIEDENILNVYFVLIYHRHQSTTFKQHPLGTVAFR